MKIAKNFLEDVDKYLPRGGVKRAFQRVQQKAEL